MDILVNVAGNLRDRMIFNMTEEEWDAVIAVHLKGTFNTMRAASPLMRQQQFGRIVNMSSVAALQGLPGAPDYSAAKGALIGFTKSVAREVIGAGIRVNAIAPGWIRTPMVTEEIDPRLLPILLAQVPAGGMGEPEHIAALALHLCSDEASYTTGQVVSVAPVFTGYWGAHYVGAHRVQT